MSVKVMEYKECKYIVSLGYNCEVSFRITDFLGRQCDSFPLSWAAIQDQDKLPEILETIVSGEMISGPYNANENGMLRFTDHGYMLHTKAKDKNALLLPDGTTNYDAAEKEIPEMKGRFGHMQEKFREMLTADDRKLFVLKLKAGEPEEICRLVGDVWEFFNTHTTNFFLLAVTSRKNWHEEYATFGRGKSLAIDMITGYADKSLPLVGGEHQEWRALLSYYASPLGGDHLCRDGRLNCAGAFLANGASAFERLANDTLQLRKELEQCKLILDHSYLLRFEIKFKNLIKKILGKH